MGKTIHDVVVKKLATHSDDRGYFREILRDDDNLLRNFGQTAVTKTYPGVIKAFHWHKDQDDIWYVADGMARVVLYDRRPDSPTKGVTQVIYAGQDNPVSILIPTGLAHGYQVIGNEPVLLFYHVTKSYNPADPDEQRIDFIGIGIKDAEAEQATLPVLGHYAASLPQQPCVLRRRRRSRPRIDHLRRVVAAARLANATRAQCPQHGDIVDGAGPEPHDISL